MLQALTPAPLPVRFDGLLGQEDEWNDVEDGKLEPPTADTPQSPPDDAQPPADDHLRQMEEKFARTVNIDKPLN